MDRETEIDENEKYNLPCPYDASVNCVQMPDDDSCGCDPCQDCPINKDNRHRGE